MIWANRANTPSDLAQELVQRGYSEEDLQKLWSGNVLRVMRANEAVAGEAN